MKHLVHCMTLSIFSASGENGPNVWCESRVWVHSVQGPRCLSESVRAESCHQGQESGGQVGESTRIGLSIFPSVEGRVLYM